MAYPKSEEELIQSLNIIGFTPKEKSNIITFKNKINIYLDKTDFRKSSIDYGDISVKNKTICNFTKNEYLVQLECVTRLLNKGYSEKSIVLERHFPVGRGLNKSGGRLDVCIYDKKKCWAMIECKTYGKEYDAEITNTLNDGGQIFSYLTQDRKAKTILVYASKPILTEKNIAIKYAQINTDNLLLDGDTEDILSSWDKKFYSNGLFDSKVGLYETTKVNLRKEDLIDLTRDSGNKLFHNFDEILRKHVISDKSNAFNVIFNLFVCKIYDEDTKADNEELDFQTKIGDSDDALLKRLSLLYIESIEKYLSMEPNKKYLTNDMAIKEFSFIDVFNDETFYKNISIIIEVVKLLEKFRIKYSTKHQFMGEFFEHLLTTGVKQESGQFFTPIPLARFILKSLPIENIIQKKIKAKEPYILPHIIDYACGSGHFLTEAIDEIDSFIPLIKERTLTGQQKRFLLNGKDYYLWARDYIYGIEKDHRLSKTTKIAMFLNGDGDASVLSGDGLDDFYDSKYSGLLKSSEPTSCVNNFDIVASNPPYSVERFSSHVKNIKNNFTLSDTVSDTSSEIESFFIERTLQLLKEDGVSGLILPLSIFNNKNTVYIQARKLLLLYTDIVSIVELEAKAFMSTPTKTCIFFFRKRNVKKIIFAVEKVIKDKEEKEIIKKQLLSKTLFNNLLLKENNQLFSDVSEYLNQHEILIAYSGEKKRQEFFLGYRFTKGRKGEHGINLHEDSMLFGYKKETKEENRTNYLNQHILNSFLQGKEEITGELKKHALHIPICKLIDEQNYFIMNRPSFYIAEQTQVIESISPFGDFIDLEKQDKTSLKEMIKSNKLEFISGVTYNKKDEVPQETNVKVLTASNINLATGRLLFGEKIIYLDNNFTINGNQTIKKWDIVISMSSGSLKHLGKVAIAGKDYPDILVGGFLSIIRASSKELSLAIYFRLMSKPFRKMVFSKKGQNINNLGSDFIKENILIPQNIDDFFKKANEKLLIHE